ncbi:MAG TPA: RusA family crossover junction endodeoxyribonuclease [Thermomicrobiales bacterium]|nr:RusA family crossover junction endodeoxyribonuclease [Thermomicrobiales bacterium]
MPQPPVSLSLTLPLPPGVNNQYVTVGRRRVLSAPAKSFNRDVAKLIDRLRRDGTISLSQEHAFSDALLGVYLTFFFETPHRRDLDGGLKIALDALARGLGFDDRAIVDLHLIKRIDPLRPRLEVELETIADWEFDRTYVFLGDDPPPTDDGPRDDAVCDAP